MSDLMQQFEIFDERTMAGPTFAPGTVVEHSEISMNARDGSYFGLPKDPSARHDFEIPLSFWWRGPDMSWRHETHGHAHTRAIHSVVLSSATSYKAILQIANRVAGGCGPENTGGWGRAAPEYHTSFDVPVVPAGATWTVRFSLKAAYENVAGGIDGRPVGPCHLLLKNPDGTVVDYDFERKGSYSYEIKPAMKGLYGLSILGSEVAKGCFGAASGTLAQGHAYINVEIEIFAS